MHQVVGIGEWLCTDGESGILVTYALSTCVAVTVYCPYRKVSGMIHILLPEPRKAEEGRERPGRFASTGIPLMIRHMTDKYGCRKQSLEVHMYGGASPLFRRNLYTIGSRNLEQSLAELRKFNMFPRRSETGGHISRTLEMNAKTGEIQMRTLPLSS